MVENRPGNSSMLAATAVSRAENDGYTLFMATVAQTLNPAHTGSSFNLAKNMQPIALRGFVLNVLVAHPLVKANNLKELIEVAKTNPDSLTFGTSGNGPQATSPPNCSIRRPAPRSSPSTTRAAQRRA